jgi:hypothetical protein
MIKHADPPLVELVELERWVRPHAIPGKGE